MQTSLRCLASSLDALFFLNVKGRCHGCFFDDIWQHWKNKKCEIDRAGGKWSDMQTWLARGAATDCRPLIPTVHFWALEVLSQGHQRRWWGRRPVGSLAQLSSGEVELCVLLSNSVHCVAEAAWCQLDQFERSKLLWVPRFANLVAMFGQFVRPVYFCSNVNAIVTAVSLSTFGNIERPKMWNRQLQMVRLSKSHLQEKRKTDCHPLIPTVHFWALEVLSQGHQRRWWGRRPAGSLAQLSSGEVELCVLLSNSVHCVAEAAWCQLDQFERSKLLWVPRFANFVAMFGQFVRRFVFFEC